VTAIPDTLELKVWSPLSLFNHFIEIDGEFFQQKFGIAVTAPDRLVLDFDPLDERLYVVRIRRTQGHSRSTFDL
jgi:hypothetical protein